MLGKVSKAFRDYLAPGQPPGYGEVTIAVLAIVWGISKLNETLRARQEQLAELGEQIEQARAALVVVQGPDEPDRYPAVTDLDPLERADTTTPEEH